jgi:RNA polymerase sigma-70 factor, ECF subfamily
MATALAIPSATDGHREATLIHQILRGRQELLGDLIKPHLDILRRFVQTKMGRNADVEDVVQQTILKAFTHLDQFRFEACFRTWLIRIAINEVAQLWRKRTSHQRLGPDGFLPSALQAKDRGDCPLHTFERSQSAKLLHHAIGNLPEKYQVVVRMRDLEERSLLETAKALRLTTAAVKSRQHRGRLRIAQLLSREMAPAKERALTAV